MVQNCSPSKHETLREHSTEEKIRIEPQAIDTLGVFVCLVGRPIREPLQGALKY